MRLLNSKSKYSAEELFFEGFYKEYYLKAVHYAHQYIVDYELSKELVQDAFMIIWEKRNSLDLEQNIASYLFTIVRNKCLNTIRDKIHKQKNFDAERSMDLLINQRSLQDESAMSVLNKELTELINQTLKTMPEKIRSVFELNRDENITYKEIASSLGISEKAIEYRMSKALAIFRKALADYLPTILIFLKF